MAIAAQLALAAALRRAQWARALGAALPGVFLLLALHAALSGAPLVWVAAWLAASWPAHLWDLRARLRDR